MVSRQAGAKPISEPLMEYCYWVSAILIEIRTFLFEKRHSKMSYGKWRPFCLGFNELIRWNLRRQIDVILAHSCRDKMVAIWETNENFSISSKMSLTHAPGHPLGDKPFSETMMALFTDTYMRHSASIGWCYHVHNKHKTTSYDNSNNNIYGNHATS